MASWFKPRDVIVEACPEQPFGALQQIAGQFFPPKLKTILPKASGEMLNYKGSAQLSRAR